MAVKFNTNGGGGVDCDNATATTSDIVDGKTAGIAGNDELVVGTLPIKDGWSSNVGMNASVTVPYGKHNGQGKVNGPAVTQRGAWTGSVAMNGAVTVPEGYHNGQGKVNGPAVTQRGAWTGSVGMNGSVVVPGGYHNGQGRVNGPAVTQRPNGGTKGTGLGWNSSGLYYYIPEGYYPSGSSNPWVYMTRAEIASIITSAVSFSVAQYANLTMIATWARPSTGPWSGLRVMAKQGNYPASVSDGTCIYHGSGTSVTTTLAAGVWYFRAWNYLTCKDGGTIYGGYVQTTCNNATIRGQQTFTASGTFTVPAAVRTIDIFIVGAGGGCYRNTSNNSGGGGGGYTNTYKGISVSPGQQLSVNIGAGGSGDGGATSVGGYSVAGGKTGNPDKLYGNGGDGGSGGGANASSDDQNAGKGGSDGSGGERGDSKRYGGSGQSRTTRAFGESSGELYAGGGGGRGYESHYFTYSGEGGAGGGGGGYASSSGGANTGGGGGGVAYYNANQQRVYEQSLGGSGIAIIRWGY